MNAYIERYKLPFFLGTQLSQTVSQFTTNLGGRLGRGRAGVARYHSTVLYCLKHHIPSDKGAHTQGGQGAQHTSTSAAQHITHHSPPYSKHHIPGRLFLFVGDCGMCERRG